MVKGKVLVLGGTGAMGTYVVPELIEMGYQVEDVVQHLIKTPAFT